MSESEEKKLGSTEIVSTSAGSIEQKEIQVPPKDGKDAAFQLASKANEIELTEEQNKKLLWKIDCYIQPIMWVIYGLQFMDKMTNSYAGVMNIEKDLNLVGDQFTWLGSGFYLAYLVAEFPMSQALQRLPFIKTLSGCIIIWGIILCAHAGAHNSAQIITARVFLGIFESTVTPGFVILSSQWYKKEEQFSRIAFWFSCNGLGNLLGGAIAYGLAKHADSLPIEAWRVLFIVTGLITLAFGVLFYFYVPENPNKAWFLTEEEKLQQVQRIRSNQQGYGSRKFKGYQLREAFKDPRTWLYVLYGLTSTIPNGGLGSFGNILLNKTLGYTPTESLLMGLPQGAIQICSGIITGFISTKTGNRILIGAVCCLISLLGTSLLAFTNNQHTQLAGYYLFPFYAIGMVAILALIASDAAGHTKKFTVSAIFLVSYCVGNLIGPQTFRAKDAPLYEPARVTMAACLAVSSGSFFLILFTNFYENKKRDTRFKEDPNWYIAPENAEFLDLTDFENKNFRYSF